MLFDGDLATAWSEGRPDLGVGEWVELRWERPVRLDGLAFVPGYPKSTELFLKNSAPARLHLEIDGEAGPSVHVGYRVEMHHEPDAPAGTREMGCYPTAADADAPWRVWVFSEPREVSVLRLVIDEAFRGTAWQDTLIAELVFVGPDGPHRALPPEVSRAFDAVKALRDGRVPSERFASRVSVAFAVPGRAERNMMATWIGRGQPDPGPVTFARPGVVAPLAPWWAGNRAGLVDVPVAVRGPHVIGGMTETFGDGEWAELHPVVTFDGAGAIEGLTEWRHYDGSPGCHHVIPSGP